MSEAQELLAESIRNIDQDVTIVENQLNESREEMEQLKVALYTRFGKSINLES